MQWRKHDESIKSSYSSGSGNKMVSADPGLVPFKLDKMPDNEPFANNLNRKFGYQEGSQNFQYNSNPQKSKF